MSLFHGTSAGAALDILTSQNNVSPSKDGYLYCFSSDKPESMAGALCFATGGTLRNGCIDPKKPLSQYYLLNPDFPTGLKGAFAKLGLQMAISSWAKTQRLNPVSAHADRAAIIVFQDHADALHVNSAGFVNEVKVPSASFATLAVEKAYFDDALMDTPAVVALKEKGIAVEPLSTWAQQINQQEAALKSAKAQKKRGNGPKL